MARVKHVREFIDANVLDEARRRMHHIYDVFDTVLVAFSGGKDSLVCVHLAREVALERGDERPIKVVFRDEELIPDSVVQFVDEYRRLDWVDLRWYCMPLASTKYILGTSTQYIQWDPNREHIRPEPDWAITPASLGLPNDRVYDQYSMDTLAAKGEKGKVAMVTGVRAAESLMRFRALTAKLTENYINTTTDPRVFTVKPIFDWQEDDVFRYFYDYDIRYCPTYDAQLWAKEPLRVSTPLHAERAKRFDNIRAYEPMFYDQVIALFPEMAVQERYYSELDRAAIIQRYGASLDGVQAWIDDTIEDEQQKAKALKELRSIRIKQVKTPEAYPSDYVLTQFMAGAYKRSITALSKEQQAARRKAKV
ncbi:nucleotidyltransferase [Mycobacterium phage prophi79-1]|uniref:phosphoadenosine phosphosulfate reductase domain-containing protein n=1 Tax=Mycobacteroides abscessus TaxID=36809 RepID=UPI0019D0A6EE|nr:phosphoadenosine phosphosulfate reductase family protein [Mycobacteroides abscessus]MBN7317901.1 phosphoadenosine phosphosulfate reductase family protein [Mycobacteroides abscessus subsp. massiliense]QSM01882.1 nucleotidyltransferase [Mycobacterium phage prophi79-1]